MQLTLTQKFATISRNSSLLLSAGAGSGKTAVLTERIVRRLCDVNDDVNITDLLIVTFTNAAAKELSDRIRKKLSDRAKEEPHNKKIIHNLAILPLAKISTINAFCYDLVRRNFQKLGLSSSIRIADDAEIAVIREKLMNETLESAFEEMGEDKDFILTYEIFSGAKSDSAFVETLLNLDNKLRQMPDRRAFEAKSLALYDELIKCDEVFCTTYGRALKKRVTDTLATANRKLKLAMDLCDDEIMKVKYLPVLEIDFDYVNRIFDTTDMGNDTVKKYIDSYDGVKFPPIKSADKTAYTDRVRELRKAAVSSVKDELSGLVVPSEIIRNAADDCRRVVSMCFKILDAYGKRLDERKKALGIVDFNDVEHYSLTLLCRSITPFEVTENALEMQKDYKEIYIDEYQDVNPLQDAIFKAIARKDEKGREYSRFLVGDIKQSIYRFRGANPDIFALYRDTFADFHAATDCRKKLFMQDNFRCSKGVIDFTNRVFGSLMYKKYTWGDRLNFARSEALKTDALPSLLIIEGNKQNLDGHSAEEAEAYLIASKILETVDNPDELSSEGKRFGFSDVAVLARSKTGLKVYEEVLTACGIPVFSNVGESFYGRKEILFALCMLNSIDNPERDIYLAGFMRSVFVGFSDDELCLIKQNSLKNKLWQSVKIYAENKDGKADAELCAKCKGFIAKLTDYRKMSRGKNAAEFLWTLFVDLDVLNVCASPSFNDDSVDVGKDRRKNLLKLYEMARSYTKTSFRGLGSFLDYINGSMEKTDVKADRILDGDCVNLMTIHSSKGLEFPVCFVSDLARGFNKMDERQKMVLSDNVGIGVKLRDTDSLLSQKSATGCTLIDTPFRKIVSTAEGEACIQEEIRILYVALTRARDRLFMTCCKDNTEKLYDSAVVKNIFNEFSGASSYIEMLFNVLCTTPDFEKLIHDGEVKNGDCFNGKIYKEGFGEIFDGYMSHVAPQETPQDRADSENNTDEVLLKELSELGSFRYKFDQLYKLPSKLTVSMLKTGLIDEDGDGTLNVGKAKRALKTCPDFVSDGKEKSAAEKGTATHMFMQFAPFSDCEAKGCAGVADDLLARGFIDEKQREMLDIPMLDGFFASDTYGDIKKSKKVYREQRFNLETDASELSEKIEKGRYKVLVQGVIDLFYENSDGTYTVVDFKTDRVSGSDGEEKLRQRHSPQLVYYCRAVEEMTDKPVSRAFLYSFSLMSEVDVDYKSKVGE